MQGCHRCQQFAHDIAVFNTDIHATLNVNAPAQLIDKILLAKGIRASRHSNMLGHWLKTAIASVAVISTSIGSYLYLNTPLLIEQIALDHVREELHHLDDRNNVQLARLNDIFKPLQMKLQHTAHTINYAGRCKIGNSDGVHVILQGKHSPVTLLFMPGEKLDTRKTLQDDSFTTVVLPLKKGSVAIIGNKQEKLDTYEKQIQQQLTFI